jgi:hypothetical protein
MFCQGIYKSGLRKNQNCDCYAWENGYCGRHQSQIPLNPITIINNTDSHITIYYITRPDDPWYGRTHSPQLVCNIQSEYVFKINTYNNDITKYFISYSENPLHEVIDYYFREKDIISINSTDAILIVPSPKVDLEEGVYKYKSLYDSWKKVALKALHLPKDIKKLTNSETVKEMCDMTEYIDLPEEITERDYQLAGATYNPDDEFNPEDYDEGEVGESIELDVTEDEIRVQATWPLRRLAEAALPALDTPRRQADDASPGPLTTQELGEIYFDDPELFSVFEDFADAEDVD